ncbi:MAG: hypothetical protein ACLTMX_12650, partial [Roseburia faecis]
ADRYCVLADNQIFIVFLKLKKAFYRGIDDDVPDEAECGGAGKHLYFIDDGDGHGVYHGLYVCGS